MFHKPDFDLVARAAAVSGGGEIEVFLFGQFRYTPFIRTGGMQQSRYSDTSVRALQAHCDLVQFMVTNIRLETLADLDEIHRIEAAAFKGEPHADLVDRLRAEDALLLSQVAELNSALVGHAAYTLLTITDGDARHRLPGLGPIAVDPPFQGRGIGSALVRAGIGAMRDMGYGLLFLVGSPRYYPRFGFQPAQPLGFSSDYVEPGGPHEHFMVALLDERAPGSIRGHARFHPAFYDV